MPLYEPFLSHGVRDTPPPEARARRYVQRHAEAQFEVFGFEPMQTPVLERYETLRGQYGVVSERQLLRLHPTTEAETRDSAAAQAGEALRFDLTVPLARYVARERRNLDLPFRRYQVGPVFRAQPSGTEEQHEFSRELWQADADIIGSESRFADAEIIALAHAVLRHLGLDDAVITLNHRALFRGLQTILGIQANTFTRLMQILNRFATQDEANIREQLQNECGLSESQIERVFSTLTLSEATTHERLDEAQHRLAESEVARSGVDELRRILDGLEAFDVPASAVKLDLFTTRTFDYYTGLVFKTQLPRLPGLGSVISGGRYGDMIAGFLGQVVPAVGLSVRVDRLADALMRLESASEAAMTTTRLVILAGPSEDVRDALRLASRFREAGIACEVSFEPAPLAHEAKRAERLGIPFLASLVPGEPDRLQLQSALDPHGAEFTVEQAIAALDPTVRNEDRAEDSRIAYESETLDTQGLPAAKRNDRVGAATEEESDDDGVTPEEVQP